MYLVGVTCQQDKYYLDIMWIIDKNQHGRFRFKLIYLIK